MVNNKNPEVKRKKEKRLIRCGLVMLGSVRFEILPKQLIWVLLSFALCVLVVIWSYWWFLCLPVGVLSFYWVSVARGVGVLVFERACGILVIWCFCRLPATHTPLLNVSPEDEPLDSFVAGCLVDSGSLVWGGLPKLVVKFVVLLVIYIVSVVKTVPKVEKKILEILCVLCPLRLYCGLPWEKNEFSDRGCEW